MKENIAMHLLKLIGMTRKKGINIIAWRMYPLGIYFYRFVQHTFFFIRTSDNLSLIARWASKMKSLCLSLWLSAKIL
jgi:hypothetical protein